MKRTLYMLDMLRTNESNAYAKIRTSTKKESKHFNYSKSVNVLNVFLNY